MLSVIVQDETGQGTPQTCTTNLPSGKYLASWEADINVIVSGSDNNIESCIAVPTLGVAQLV